MGTSYLIKWKNPDAVGSVDLINTDFFSARQPRINLTHATLVGRDVRISTFDIQPDGEAMIFRYGGRRSEVNKKQGIYRGDMRIFPAKFPTSTTLEWRDNERQDWEMLPVRIRPAAYSEGAHRQGRSTYVVRSSPLAFLKRAEAKAQGGLKCKTCCFVGPSAYGDAIEQCFEVHHKQFVSLGKRVTNLDDLVLVCANCHRAIHGLGDISFDDFVSRFK